MLTWIKKNCISCLFSLLLLYSSRGKEVQFSYAQVFIEKGKENNGCVRYYERNFSKSPSSLQIPALCLAHTKPPDIRPILQNGRFLAVLQCVFTRQWKPIDSVDATISSLSLLLHIFNYHINSLNFQLKYQIMFGIIICKMCKIFTCKKVSTYVFLKYNNREKLPKQILTIIVVETW